MAASLLVAGLVAVPPALANPPFFFSTGTPDGKMAMVSRPSSTEAEAADDFVLTAPTAIDNASFTGLLSGGGTLSNVTSVVAVEIYRVFPLDSTNPPSGHVPTRVNSPSDVAFASSSPGFTGAVVAASFTANNSVQAGGIHPIPGQTTGGNGPVTGQEVGFNLSFNPPLRLPADHYFFVPQVGVPSPGNFLWLSAPKPIVSPGTPFPAGNSDLQAWIRDTPLEPDWLRLGTDIVGGSTPPQFNGTFSLSGSVCTPITVAPTSLFAGVAGSAYSATFTASGGTAPYTFTETGALPAGISLAPNGTLSGTPSQSGTFPITVAATEASGCQGTVSTALSVASAPPGGGSSAASGSGSSTATGGSAGAASTGAGPAPLGAAAPGEPLLSGLAVKPSAFRAASSGASIARKRARPTGTTISYSDSQAATTAVTVLRRLPGRRAKRGTCARPKKGKGGRPCTRVVAAGSFSHPDTAGANSFHFTGRVGGHTLKPGRYQLQAAARGDAGAAGTPVSASIRVIR